MCQEYYVLDPYQYFSSPGLSWDALLKMTGDKLDFISDSTCINLLKKV